MASLGRIYVKSISRSRGVEEALGTHHVHVYLEVLAMVMDMKHVGLISDQLADSVLKIVMAEALIKALNPPPARTTSESRRRNTAVAL